MPSRDLAASSAFYAGTLDVVDTSACHMAFFQDPDGNALMLHKRYAPRVTEYLKPYRAG
jgi:hypothetical protein